MNHDSWLELADDYALGLLAREDLERFETHLGTPCPACRARVIETEEALAVLPAALAVRRPDPAVKTRVMNAVGARPAMPSVRWIGALSAAMAACAALLAVNLRQAQTDLAASQTRLAELRLSIQDKESRLRLVTDPAARFVPLSAPSADAKNRGMFLWNPETRSGLLVSHCLPQAPIDKVYQIWVLEAGKPVSAGLFLVDQKGCAAVRLIGLPDGLSFDQVAVTLEPAGGMVSPTGPMVLAGSLAAA